MTVLRGWKPFEIAWLVTSTLVILALSFVWRDTLIGTIASLTGIICVVLVAKGKISSFLFGIINAATYGYVAYRYGLFGESDLNWYIFLPLQFIGLFLWLKNKKSQDEAVNGEDIHARQLTISQWAILLIVIVASYLIYAQFLTYRNATLAGIDSLAVVLSVVAQVLMLFRFVEQWIIWIVINVITIALWVITLTQSGGNDWTILAMWIAFLANSIYGYINWRKISESQV